MLKTQEQKEATKVLIYEDLPHYEEIISLLKQIEINTRKV